MKYNFKIISQGREKNMEEEKEIFKEYKQEIQKEANRWFDINIAKLNHLIRDLEIYKKELNESLTTNTNETVTPEERFRWAIHFIEQQHIENFEEACRITAMLRTLTITEKKSKVIQ